MTQQQAEAAFDVVLCMLTAMSEDADEWWLDKSEWQKQGITERVVKRLMEEVD